MHTKHLTYTYQDQSFEGFLAYDDSQTGTRPAVIIAHDWSGRNEFAEQKAIAMTEKGYVGFALDMYGQGQQGQTVEEKMALIQPLLEDRELLQHRITAAVHTVAELDHVDSQRIAAMGFCFGGLCVLDLARTGADIKGVVSIHGLFNAPDNTKGNHIKAKVLALHGHDDPMVPPEQVASLQQELTAANADWQIHIFGNTKHAFTNPMANDEALGTVYNEVAAKRAMLAVNDFFAKIFV